MENLIQHAYDNRNYILFARLVHMCVMSKEDIHVHVFTNFFRKNEYTPTTCIAIDVIIAILINRIRRIQCFQKLKVRLSLCHRCNDKKFVFLLAYEGVIETNSEIPKLLLGIDLLLYNYRQQSDESISVSNSSAASSLKEKLPTMTEHMARTLFSQHSNLYMITASAFKSVKYSTENHRVDLKVCFRLFCQHKGYIPYGEKEFPRRLGEYEMDVLEGYCSFGMDTSLEIGGHIRRKGGASGSIGGFVKLLNGKIGLITCAHVLFSPEELLSGIFSNSVVEAFDKSSHTFKACGKIIDAKFPVSRKATEFSSASSITLENNIDAAVVELVPTINSFGFRAVPEDQLRSAGFDPGCLPAFPGKIIPVPIPDCSEKEQIQNVSGKIPGASESVIKFGASTGFTIGDLYFNRVHARFMNQHISFYGTDIGPIMCNQIEIRNLPQGDFFSMGDSGSFVFCINPNKTLSCIGMAIGLSPSGSCLVTPIDRILQSFGLPQTLESCYPGVSIKPDTTPINPVLENISRFMESIQIQLNDLNRKVQEIDDERKNK
ncbi:uncharacterized protein LOC134259920 [Saccostrea cucullata]|uniref:uncharacterized protein LOC134259920 n=1 Tax=Saccostrea cuccullata TaxID=36930 RepID=UPI002ED6622B